MLSSLPAKCALHANGSASTSSSGSVHGGQPSMPSYRPTCSRCSVYPASADAQLCFRCMQLERQEADALEREQRRSMQAGGSPAPRNSMPYCGACLTTLQVRDVSAKTGVGLCTQCKLKHGQHRTATLAASYGQHTPKLRQPNDVY